MNYLPELRRISTPAPAFAPVLGVIFALFTFASAQGSSWLSNAGSSDWNQKNNWNPNTAAPNGPSATAVFATSSRTAITVQDITEVSSITFNSGASAFTTTIKENFLLKLSGTGITNSSGTIQNFINSTNNTTRGEIQFLNSATAGALTQFTNEGRNPAAAVSGGRCNFLGSSSAGSGVFIQNGAGGTGGDGGRCLFGANSNAGSATFTNNPTTANNAGTGGGVSFEGSSSAANAIFVNSGSNGSTRPSGFTQFTDSLGATPSAGNATLTANGGTASGAPGGEITFFEKSTAAAATLIANPGSNGGVGGSITFVDDATGGTSQVKIFGLGFLDISNCTAGVTIGSLEGDGEVFPGSKTLTVGSNNLSTTYSGVMHSTGALTKIGTGTLTLAGFNTYTGMTTVNAGSLIVSSVISGPAAVNSGGSLIDNGFVDGNVHILSGGLLSGTGEINGALLVDSGGVANFVNTIFTINGPVTNNGLIILSDGSSLDGVTSFTNNGTLDIITAGTFTPPPNFVNNGVILDSSAVKTKAITRSGSNILITINSNTGHTYHLQKSDTPEAADFEEVGSPQTGNTGQVLTFTDPISIVPAFYRFVVDP